MVDMDEKSIVYLDSGSGEDHMDDLINIAKYLVDEHRAKKASEAGQSLFGNIKIDYISLLFNILFYEILGWKLINAVRRKIIFEITKNRFL